MPGSTILRRAGKKSTEGRLGEKCEYDPAFRLLRSAALIQKETVWRWNGYNSAAKVASSTLDLYRTTSMDKNAMEENSPQVL